MRDLFYERDSNTDWFGKPAEPVKKGMNILRRHRRNCPRRHQYCVYGKKIRSALVFVLTHILTLFLCFVSCMQSMSTYIYKNLFFWWANIFLGKKILEHWFVVCVKSESLTPWLVVASSCSHTIAWVFVTHAGCAKVNTCMTWGQRSCQIWDMRWLVRPPRTCLRPAIRVLCSR